VFLGGIIVLLGVLLTLDNMDLLDFEFFHLWPVLVVVWGLSMIVRRGGALQKLIGGIIALAGVALLLSNLGLWRVSFGDLWPLLLIMLGLSILFGARSGSGRLRVSVLVGPGSGGGTGGSEEAFLRRWVALGGLDQKITSHNLTGGEITAVMGGIELDLREAEMAGEQIDLEVFALMSGIVLQIPPGWEVTNEVMAVAGAVEDKTGPPAERGAAPARRLVLRGHAIMAGVEVKH
jgi:hypothetical protein